MGRLLFSLFFLIVFCFCSSVWGLEELRVLAPDTLKGDFLTGGLIKEVPALFGVPTYREARTGQLVIASPADGCSTIDKTNWPSPNDPTNPDGSPVSVILLIKRGTCSFVTKVRNAETAGARFVIVYNDKAATFLPFMADDGTGKNIGIPSVLITNEDATKLINYITAHAGTKVLMSLLYRLPNPDNRVEWDLFTSSWDPQTLEFKEEMIPVVKALDTQQFFTPHYYILDGKAIGCSNDQGNQCGTQCTHGGQYCAVDPERNMNTGIDGKDVILQDLREYCVNQWINATYQIEGKNQYLYFEFVSQFARQCYNITNPSLWQKDECAYQILDKLKIDKQYIANCIAASGGADGTDPNKENTILKQFIKEREDYGVFSLPYSFVNAYPYRGGYTCTDPIRNDGRCGVVEAICQGFADTPAACNTDGSCAFGVAMDQCGVCGGDSTSCLGCDGVVKSGKIYDACGVCGGDGKCQQLSTGQIVGIVFASLLSVGLLSIGVYLYMKRQNKKMREDIDSLLKQYLPLEGGTNQGAGNHQPGGRLVDVNDSDM